MGGIAGYAYNVNYISNCWAVADVSGKSGHTGGIVGNSAKKQLNCYAAGTVTKEATGSQIYTGGIAGYSVQSTSQSSDGCLTLQKGITAEGICQRVLGYNWAFENSQMAENTSYVYDKMTTPENLPADESDPGIDITVAAALMAQTDRDAGWDENIWLVQDGALTQLRPTLPDMNMCWQTPIAAW